jgi:flagellar basal-body rod protein FlgF
LDVADAVLSCAKIFSTLGAHIAKQRRHTEVRVGKLDRFMPYGMYISAAGADVQSQRLQVLSNNLANVATPGFKREFAIFQARHAEDIEKGRDQAGSRSVNDLSGGVKWAESVTDFSGGTLEQTGNPTDFALEGEGFFLVGKGDQNLLTRAGNFHFAPDGRLLTDQGYPVLGADRQPIAINPAAPWQLLEQGFVSQAGNQIPLAIVQPQSLGDLAKAGENLFSPLAEVRDVAPGERRVASGFLEQSAVQPALEMMELIETSRAYEANVRMIQNQDHLLASLVNRVLRV